MPVKAFFGDEISTVRCREIGQALAAIHSTDFSELGLIDQTVAEEPIPDWRGYLEKGIAVDAPWVPIVRNHIDCLYDYSDRAYAAGKILSVNTLIMHADLEPKNVLWHDNTPYIIDWESAGFVNPMHDLLETAVYWSKDHNGALVKDKFLVFIRGYKSIIQDLPSDWNAVLEKGSSGMLGWLDYSFKRALWIECADKNENNMGIAHISSTVLELNTYAYNTKNFFAWLKELF